MIPEFLDAIQQRIGDFFQGFADLAYIGGYFTIGLVLFVGALALTWFFGGLPVIGRWISGLGGVAVLLYIAFLVGMTLMYRHGSAEREALRAKIKDLQQQRQRPGGWFN